MSALAEFLPRLIAGMVVNFEIAALALLLGFALGFLLAAVLLYGGAVGAMAATAIALMRAAPTFVVMFFLVNAIPHDAELFGIPFELSGVMTVALSLVPYAAAYIADSGLAALQQMRGGEPLGALLFLPNLMRAFFVMVMSSGAAAAIGVTEGISVILREAEHVPSFGGRLVLFAIGIVCFGIPLQAGLAAVRHIQRRLSLVLLRRHQTGAS
jgi:ABC-type arginine transport system permease subunit